jgi:hypothetical protein
METWGVIGWLNVLPDFVFISAHLDNEKYSQQVSTFIWAFPKMSPLLCKHCPQGLKYHLGFFCSCPLGAGLKGLQKPMGTFPNESLQIIQQFVFNFLICSCPVNVDRKSKKQQNFFLIIKGFYCKYALSIHNTSSQNSNWRDNPLKVQFRLL